MGFLATSVAPNLLMEQFGKGHLIDFRAILGRGLRKFITFIRLGAQRTCVQRIKPRWRRIYFTNFISCVLLKIWSI